jgi:Sulfotransferase family
MSATAHLSQEEIVARADVLFEPEQSKDLRTLVAGKGALLQHYGAEAMDRVAAILPWGRSGSVLLSSQLDGHDDVLMLPALRSDGIYRFHELYPSLSLRQKLMAYPVFTDLYDATSADVCGPSIFAGEFAISPTQYYASIQAICQAYADGPPAFLASRRAFFVLMHVAYSLALDRRPATPRPLIVCAQHGWDDARARRLVEDFPQARFVHAIRDPISSFDRLFSWYFDPDLLPPRQPPKQERAAVALGTHRSRYISAVAPWSIIGYLIARDGPQSGMETRTRAIRFEDLHCDTAQTMRSLCDWLGISYQATLLDSTFNGKPYVVTGEGNAWSGPRPEKAKRCFRNLAARDRALIFALLYENFAAWDYPCPRIFAHRTVRCLMLVLLPLLPMKMEFITARGVIRRRLLPALRRGDVGVAADSVLRIVFCRLGVFWLLVREASRRLVHPKTLLATMRSGPPAGHVDRELTALQGAPLRIRRP